MGKRYERLYFDESTVSLIALKKRIDAGETIKPCVIKAAGWRKPRICRAVGVEIFEEPDLIGNAGWVRFDMKPTTTDEERKTLGMMLRTAASIDA